MTEAKDLYAKAESPITEYKAAFTQHFRLRPL